MAGDACEEEEKERSVAVDPPSRAPHLGLRLKQLADTAGALGLSRGHIIDEPEQHGGHGAAHFVHPERTGASRLRLS